MTLISSARLAQDAVKVSRRIFIGRFRLPLALNKLGGNSREGVVFDFSVNPVAWERSDKALLRHPIMVCSMKERISIEVKEL